MGCGEEGERGGGEDAILFESFPLCEKFLTYGFRELERNYLPPSLPPSRFLAIQTAGGGGGGCVVSKCSVGISLSLRPSPFFQPYYSTYSTTSTIGGITRNSIDPQRRRIGFSPKELLC